MCADELYVLEKFKMQNSQMFYFWISNEQKLFRPSFAPMASASICTRAARRSKWQQANARRGRGGRSREGFRDQGCCR